MRRVLALVPLLLAGACGTLTVGEEIAVTSPILELKTGEVKLLSVEDAGGVVSRHEDLFVAAVDMGLVPDSFLRDNQTAKLLGGSREKASARARRLYPEAFRKDKVARSIVSVGIANVSAANNRKVPDDWKLEKGEYTRGELEDFSKLTFAAIGPIGAIETDAAADRGEVRLFSGDKPRPRFLDLAFEYYATYLKGEYVDRTGTKYPKPELTLAVGNETIVPAFAVLFDAFFDALLRTPVYCTDAAMTKALVATMPTAAVFQKSLKVAIVQRGDPGISEAEARAILYLSGVAAAQSKHLSGLIVRLFGDFTLSFVVGGNFSFGDNDTLALVVDQFAERLARHSTEHGSAALFQRVDGDKEVELVKRLMEIYKKLEASRPS
jgi:hypothetical protein